jgi:tRNA threonylcarbamoyl adenosine modification protein (Sua5/YciO/YrdC/YwlC family)
VVTVTSIRRELEHGGFAAAAEALAGGSVVAVPTDTVYGLAVVPSMPGAVERLFSLKGRPKDVAVPVLVAGWPDVGQVAGQLDGAAERLAVRYWPGPLTLVVPRAIGFSVDLGGPATTRGTVGLRWPDHPVVARLCRELGPLAVTSANLHGSPPASTASEVAAVFSGLDGLGVILDGGTCDSPPSTVVECRGPATRCLREGAIPWDEIVKLPVGGSPLDGF